VGFKCEEDSCNGPFLGSAFLFTIWVSLGGCGKSFFQMSTKPIPASRNEENRETFLCFSDHGLPHSLPCVEFPRWTDLYRLPLPRESQSKYRRMCFSCLKELASLRIAFSLALRHPRLPASRVLALTSRASGCRYRCRLLVAIQLPGRCSRRKTSASPTFSGLPVNTA